MEEGLVPIPLVTRYFCVVQPMGGKEGGRPRGPAHAQGGARRDPPHFGRVQVGAGTQNSLDIGDYYSLGDEFRLKKDQRNPFRRQNGYAISCPEMFTEDKPWC